MSDTAEGAVTLAYVHSNDCTMSWHHSIQGLIGYDMAHEARIIRGGYVAMHAGTGELVEARNQSVEEFLKDRTGEWLFWTDTDMGFEADTLERLFEAADPIERPIVGALCYALREYEPDGMGGYRTGLTPTIYDWTTDGDHKGFAVRWQYSRNTLTRCNGTGSACILIHRSVFEKIAEQDGPVWYDRIRNPTTGQRIGEDLSFCYRAQKAGLPVFVHTGVQASHAKTQWLAEATFDDQLMAEAMRDAIKAKVTEPTAVIVPVLNRPQNAAPFMKSLKASNANATAYAVVGNADAASMVAWTKAGAKIIGTNRQTFAEKVNEAFPLTSEPWVLLVGDDVRFHPGWLEAAQKVGAVASVVGTNDLVNPRVLAGEHTCHPLIRRSYIEEQGASWDGPGVVAHEGYGHWYVDDEVVTVAKQRGVWGFAADSAIEHMHPLWGKAPMDETYKIGAGKAGADKALFKARLEKFAPEAVPVA